MRKDIEQLTDDVPHTSNRITRVFEICTAYESGFGHGWEQDGKRNPYDPDKDPECHEAYEIGYNKGYEVRSSNPISNTAI